MPWSAARVASDGGEVPPEELRLLRGTHWRDLVYPARKGLVWDRAGCFPDKAASRLRSVLFNGFGDGSASAITGDRTDENLYVSAPFASHVGPVVSTRDGLAGFDIR